MGFPRVPPALRPIPRRIASYGRSSDSASLLYARFIRRLMEREVPIGIEEATKTFETYSSLRRRGKYRDLSKDVTEHAYYLKRKHYDMRNFGYFAKKYIDIEHNQQIIRQHLQDFLNDVEGDPSPHFY